MKSRQVQILVILAFGPALASALADLHLTVHAKEASVQIEVREAAQQRIQLPPLDLSVVAEISCPAEAEPESVTISVADAHTRFGADAIADAPTVEAVISVPARQLAPVTAAGFCVAGSVQDGEELLLPGVGTAQASLRCGNENGSSVYFSSAALPLRLICVVGNDQDSSTAR